MRWLIDPIISSMKSQTLLIALFFASLSLVASLPLRAQELINLGDFGGNGSQAFGINNLNQVVGEANTSDGDAAAFLYSNGNMTNLGTLGGLSSTAMGINDLGEIVGWAEINDGHRNAFLYSNGVMTNLSIFSGTNNFGYASGINNSGQVAWTYAGSGFRAVLYSNGTSRDLGSLGGGATSINLAEGINNLGQVVGTSNGSAFIYSNGTLTNLNVSGGEAIAINNVGQIVGSSTTGAFLYSNGTVTDLGALGGNSAFSINDLGQVVGRLITSSSDSQGFLYSADLGLVNLNALYASLLVSGTDSQAGFTELNNGYGINNSGSIVGNGTYWDGTSSFSKAFLLMPIPEPSTWALLLGGCGLLALVRIRRSAKA